jgi:hypothetical protein
LQYNHEVIQTQAGFLNADKTGGIIHNLHWRYLWFGIVKLRSALQANRLKGVSEEASTIGRTGIGLMPGRLVEPIIISRPVQNSPRANEIMPVTRVQRIPQGNCIECDIRFSD